MKRALPTLFGLALLAVGHEALGDVIPYPNPGTVNPVTYTFTATASGPVTAYFVSGGGASYDNQLGLLINGVPTGIVGLDNHASAVGQSLVLGNANAGDTLVFALHNLTLSDIAYSDPSLNVAYDVNGSVGHNHIYSTPYTASPAIDSIPAGTYVGFEDLRFPNSDFNYNDESFVFLNVSRQPSVPEATSTLVLLSVAAGALAVLRRRLAS